jgi:hypothetical protein
VKFPKAKPAEYRLAIAITRTNSDATPGIRIGTELPTVDGWLVLDSFQLLP